MDEEAKYSEVFSKQDLEKHKQQQRFNIRSNKTTTELKKDKMNSNGKTPNK